MFSSFSSRPRLRPAVRVLVVCFAVAGLIASGCGSGSSATGSDTNDSGNSTDTETDATEAPTVEANETETADVDDEGSETAMSEDETGDAGSDDGTEAASADSGDDAYLDADNPLATFLGFDISNPDAIVEQQRLVDQEIQQCMSAQGFDYELSATSSDAFSVFQDQAEMSPTEFAAEHGYGIVDFTKQFASEAGGLGSTDPNEEMVNAMSDTERSAWETAFYGAPLDDPEADPNAMPEGCLGDALTEVYGKLAAFTELAPKLEDMEAGIEADPRVVEINARWTECMSKAGYNFENPDAAATSVSDQVDEAMAAASDPAANAAVEDETQVQEELIAQLDEIRVEEIEVATADATCQGDDAETLKEIQREYELKFIEDNKASLEAAGS